MARNLVLIGMPGCGKSTIGSKLAAILDMNYYDTDQIIEKDQGKEISEIFKHGEDYFREIESNTVKEISCYKNSIISTGGGVVKRVENIEELKKNGTIIFINRTLESIMQDIDTETRPLLKNPENLYNLYNERLPLYKKYCDVEIMNDTSLENVLNKIVITYRKIISL